jgi:hypothetical protein
MVSLRVLKYRILRRHSPWLVIFSFALWLMAYLSSSVVSNFMYASALETRVEFSSLNCNNEDKPTIRGHCPTLKRALDGLQGNTQWQQYDKRDQADRALLKTQPIAFLFSGKLHADTGFHNLAGQRNAIKKLVNDVLSMTRDERLDYYDSNAEIANYEGIVEYVNIIALILWLSMFALYYAIVRNTVNGMLNHERHKDSFEYSPDLPCPIKRHQFSSGLKGYLTFQLTRRRHDKITEDVYIFRLETATRNKETFPLLYWLFPFSNEYKCFISPDILENDVKSSDLHCLYAGNPHVAHKAAFYTALLPLCVALLASMPLSMIINVFVTH